MALPAMARLAMVRAPAGTAVAVAVMMAALVVGVTAMFTEL
jgi:hypothetical protein